jgi:hypothetical protein
MSTLGIPQSPKPPTASVAPSGTSPTASAALETTLSIDGTSLPVMIPLQDTTTVRTDAERD